MLPMTWVAEGVAMPAEGVADVVLGPSEDGGYWSVGLRVRLLPRWFDVDTEADLKKLCDEIAASGGPRRTAALASALAARLATGAAR